MSADPPALSQREQRAYDAVVAIVAGSEPGVDDDVFARITRAIEDAVDCDGVILVADDDVDRLFLRVFCVARPAGAFAIGARLPRDPDEVRREARPDAPPLVVERIEGGGRLEQAIRAAGMKSCVSLPVWVADTQAWLGIMHAVEGAPSQGSLPFLEKIAHVLGVWLARALVADRYRLLAGLMDASPDGMIALDRAHIVREVNHAALHCLARSRAEVIGRPLAEVFGDTASSSIMAACGAEVAHLTIAVADRICDVEVSPITRPREADWQILLRDARPRLEREIEQGEARVRRTYADRLASLGALAGGVAHEINNPVAFIMLAMGQIRKAVGRGDVTGVAELVDEVEDATERIAHIVGELKLFSRIPQGAVTTPIDVNRMVQTAITLSSTAIERVAALEVAYGELPLAPGSFATLCPAFVNILLNAAEAVAAPGMSHAPRVTVKTSSEDGAIVVTVTDNGAGMRDETIDRAFEPFFTTKAQGEGAGLGLAIAQDLVQRSGGYIQVTSAPGEGSTFRIVLPLGALGSQ